MPHETKKINLVLAQDQKLWRKFLDDPKNYAIIQLPEITNKIKMMLRNVEQRKGVLFDTMLFSIFHRETKEIVFIFDTNLNGMVVSEEDETEESVKFFEDNQERFKENLQRFLLDTENYFD